MTVTDDDDGGGVTSEKIEAALAAIDKYGGCTINVEDDDYDGAPAWEVEVKNSDVENGANGRIEVKVDKDSYAVLAKEDADSDDGECNSDYPAADSSNDNGDSTISPEDAGTIATDEHGGTIVGITADEFEGAAVWAVDLDGTDQGRILVMVDQVTGEIINVTVLDSDDTDRDDESDSDDSGNELAKTGVELSMVYTAGTLLVLGAGMTLLAARRRKLQ